MADQLKSPPTPLWRMEDDGHGLVNVVHVETNLRLVRSCTKQAAQEALATLDALGLTDDPECLEGLLRVRSEASKATPSESFSLELTAKLSFTVRAADLNSVNRYAEGILTDGDTTFRVADLLSLCSERDSGSLGVSIIVSGPLDSPPGGPLGKLTGGDLE
jgi:hypothetical protein